MTRLLSILLGVLIAASAITPTPVTGRPRNTGGSYSVVVAGHFKGPGTASISGTSLTVTANVTGQKGVTGQLTFSAPIRADHRFSVTGSVINQSAVFTGRIDAPDDQKERGIKGVRISATFKTNDGRFGRIIGWVPNDTRFPLDEFPGRGKGPPAGPGGGGGGNDKDDND